LRKTVSTNDQELRRDFDLGEFPLEYRNLWSVWMAREAPALIWPARRLGGEAVKVVNA
jgi:hypothetical protein